MDRVERLSSTYRGWRIWQSGVGRWWAADETVTWDQILNGCSATIDADNLDQLEVLLGQQAEQRSLASQRQHHAAHATRT